jgi:hypothetical protein
MAVDDNGQGLYTTGLGHGDALHLADMDLSRPGLDVDARVIVPLNLLGGINPQMGGMPQPPGWHTMTPRQQHIFHRDWERSPAGVAYRRHLFADQTTIAPDGTFRFDVLRPGRYSLSVRSLVLVPDQSMLEDVAGGSVDFTVPLPPPDTKVSETVVDVGTIELKPVPRIVPGTPAPAFEATTPDGKPVKLDDFKGKYLVLQVRWPNLPDEETAGLKKAYEAFANDPQFAMLTVRGPATIYLIGPEGTVVSKLLRGSDVETAVAKVRLER